MFTNLILILFFATNFSESAGGKGNESSEKTNKNGNELPSKMMEKNSGVQNENKDQLMKKEIETQKAIIDKGFNKFFIETLPSLVVELDKIVKKITNTENHIEKTFIQGLIDQTWSIYVNACSDLMLLLAKLRLLTNDSMIKKDAIKITKLNLLKDSSLALINAFDEGKKLIGIFHEERTELERNTQRDQGDAALNEYDQKFVNSLRLNVQESRDFGYIFVVLADQQKDVLSGLQQKS